jgi:hypothetical protein
MSSLRPRGTEAMLLSLHDNQKEPGEEIILNEEIVFLQEVLRGKAELSVLAGF